MIPVHSIICTPANRRHSSRPIQWSAFSKIVLLPGLLALSGFLALLSGCKQQAPPSPEKPSQSASTPPVPTVAQIRDQLPPAKDNSYVGSDSCRECHQQIAADYELHPMGQSIATIDTATPIEKSDNDWLKIPGPDKYKAIVTTNEDNARRSMTHTQAHFDTDGTLLAEQIENIAFAIGSGQKGRAYLTLEDGTLRQSPIGWYAAEAKWDLSPGYQPQKHQGFQRRIDNSCLYCHAGQVDALSEDHYSTQVFHEAMISCERCHGPGQDHIAYHKAKSQSSNTDSQTKDNGDQDPICNPKNLATASRADVCNQCHLQAEQVIPRFGRSFFDFRPGDRIEDVFVIFASNNRQANKGSFRAVSHVEQMRNSKCFQASPEKLTCTSCHDPHRNPLPEQRVEHYRRNCLNCHQDQGCSLPTEKRLAISAEDSCIDCHMPKSDIANVPHTAATDHRVIRNKEISPPANPGGKTWSVFDNAEERLPSWEVSRARGLAMMNTALSQQEPSVAMKARQYLLGDLPSDATPQEMISELGVDVPALAAIGSSLWLCDQRDMARPIWLRILELEPNNETALSGLTLLDIAANDLASAERFAKRLVAVTPSEPKHWVQLSTIRWKMGKRAEALANAEKAIQLDPSLDDVRKWIQNRNQKDSSPDP